jgi:hypothetical protein
MLADALCPRARNHIPNGVPTHYRAEQNVSVGYILQVIFHLQMSYISAKYTKFTCLYSDIELVCRIVAYAIDTSNPENMTIERYGRLPIDQGMILFEPVSQPTYARHDH